MTSKVQGVQTSKQSMQDPDKFRPDNIIHRLPSIAVHKDTLTYFENKLKEYEEEQEAFKNRLEKYKRISKDRHSLESELLKRNNKIGTLQEALSQLQNCFFFEREQNQKLQNEIDKLKMEEEESHKKIYRLLQITKGQKLHDDIVYIFDEPLGLHVRQRMLSSQRQDEEQTAVKGLFERDIPKSVNQQAQHDVVESLKKQNESVARMIEKQSELSQQKIEATVRDYNLILKEAESLSKHDREKIQQLTDSLKEAETDLMSVNTELLNLRKDLHREEILREMQKNILLNHIMDALSCVSSNDTVESIIAKMHKVIKSAFDLFESVEQHDISCSFKPDPCDPSGQTKNSINLDLYPSKVHSRTRSKSLENMSIRMDNKPLENSKSHLQHVDSMGQFIHYRAGGDHCQHPYKSLDSRRLGRCVSFSSVSPDHNKENFLKRIESASCFALRPHSCLKEPNFLSKKNITHKCTEIIPERKSQLGLIRPKTADPRRRKPPQNAILRPHSVNQNAYSDNLKGGDILSGHSICNYTPKNKMCDTLKIVPPKNGSGEGLSKPKSCFVPFPRKKSYKQSSRQVSASSKRAELKTNSVCRLSEKTTQCNLDEHDSFALNYQNNDENESAKKVVPESIGHFAPKMHHRDAHLSADLPHKISHVYDNSEHISSSLSEDSALETLVKTHKLHQTKQLDAFNLSSHKYHDGTIDNLRETIKNTNLELQEIHNRFAQDQIRLQAYENHLASLEHELNLQRNKHEALNDYQKKEKDSLIEQLRTTKSRLSRLERYRRLEVEGFQTDIKILTQKVREMEKQLYKTLLLYEASGKDMELLKTVHSATKQSMHVSNEVLRLKAKLYQLESALKQL